MGHERRLRRWLLAYRDTASAEASGGGAFGRLEMIDSRRATPEARPLVAALLLAGCQPNGVLDQNNDPGKEDYRAGWWCYDAGLPAPHGGEYGHDHPCSADELDADCQASGENGLYCRQ